MALSSIMYSDALKFAIIIEAILLQTIPHKKLEGCFVWNDTMQYSPEAVCYPCTSCLLTAFDDA